MIKSDDEMFFSIYRFVKNKKPIFPTDVMDIIVTENYKTSVYKEATKKIKITKYIGVYAKRPMFRRK